MPETLISGGPKRGSSSRKQRSLLLTGGRFGLRSYIIWLRDLDLNQGPSGYEPDETPRNVLDFKELILLSFVLWAGNWARIHAAIQDKRATIILETITLFS
jgi:hypothetical protein